MLLPMSPTSSLFLLGETREHPMHVGGLWLFQPPEGADALDVRAMFDEAMASSEVAPLFRKRARRSITSLGQWGWEPDTAFDLEHHVRRSALPQPGRVLELLALNGYYSMMAMVLNTAGLPLPGNVEPPLK